MPTRPRRPQACAIAVALLFAAAAAQADPRNEGGGDYTVSPLYRSFNFGYVSDSTSGSAVYEGLDYASNVAPIVNSVETGRIDLEGSTAWYTGSAQYSGFYAARTYASMTVNNAQADQTYYWVAGQGTTTSVTFYDPAAAAARAVFRWHVSGTSSASAGGWADGRVDFFATTESGRDWTDLFNGGFSNTLFEYGPGNFEYTLPTAPLGTPIYLYFWTSAFVQVEPGAVQAGSNFTITADYARTVVLESVTLYDENDQRLTNWSMVDNATNELLFSDGVRHAEIAPMQPVPEPGGWAMMTAGLAALGWLRRRRPAR